MLPPLDYLGPRIRELRLSRAWTRQDLASRVGTSSACLSQIEWGERAPLRPCLERIAEALEVPLAELVSASDVEGWSVWSRLVVGRSNQDVRLAAELLRTLFRESDHREDAD